MEITMHDFMTEFAEQFEARVERVLDPVYRPQDKADNFGSKVEPYAVQREVVNALAAGYKSGMNTIFLVAEPGSGKTYMSIFLSKKLKAKRTLIMCPPHLVGQWAEHIKTAYPDSQVAVIPDQSQRAAGISNMAQLQKVHESKSADYVVISREAIKTDFPTKLQIKQRKNIYYNEQHGRTEVQTVSCCPSCFSALSDKEESQAFKSEKPYCPHCGSAMYTYVKSSASRPSLAKYIHKKMKGFFSLFVPDEIQELNGGGTAQGVAFGKLASQMRTLTLTGTLMGGYSSHLFYLLQRANPGQMLQEGFKYDARTAFVEKYGAVEKIVEVEERKHKRSIGKWRNREELRERPGLSPLVVGVFLLDKAVFVRLSDFAEKLPNFNEHPIACQMHPSLMEGYKSLASYKNLLHGGCCRPPKVISGAIQALLAYPDTHTREEIYDVDKNGIPFLIISAPEVKIPLGETAKEKDLVRIVTEAKSLGRKVLVYTTQSRKRDLQPRIKKLLDQNGIRSAIMTTAVSTAKRDAWIQNRAKSVDAMITHPRLVSTGLNLLPFVTIVFYDTGFSTFTVRQAARRSFRINQTAEVIDVYYLYTSLSAQQDCLSLMAKKQEVSLMVEGELSDSGMSALANAGGSVLGDLAKVLSGKLKTENPLEVFARINKLNNKDKLQVKEKAKQEIVEPEIITAQAPAAVEAKIRKPKSVMAFEQPKHLYVPPPLIVHKNGQLALF